MSNLLVHNMGTAWASNSPTLLQVSVDTETFSEGPASNRLAVGAGAQNASVEYVPAAPLNLSEFEELRFWVKCSQASEGSPERPFVLEFSYLDAQDAANEEHRWFVPVNQAGHWEQRRIGIQNDRRGLIQRFRFRVLTNQPFVCYLDELLAVREEMVADLEKALLNHLDNQVSLPGLTNIPLTQTVNPNNSQVNVALNQDFAVANRVRIKGGTAGDEIHSVTSISHNASTNRTTIDFGSSDKIIGTLNAGVANLSVIVPLIFESPPAPLVASNPAIIATAIEAREDLTRTYNITQRDSFRPRGTSAVCSVRPAARAYVLDYQFTVLAPKRAQQILIQTMLAQRLSFDIPLRINGFPSPVWILAPPPLLARELGLLTPLYVRIGTRMETALREEVAWVRQLEIDAAAGGGPFAEPPDQEKIVIKL